MAKIFIKEHKALEKGWVCIWSEDRNFFFSVEGTARRRALRSSPLTEYLHSSLGLPPTQIVSRYSGKYTRQTVIVLVMSSGQFQKYCYIGIAIAKAT